MKVKKRNGSIQDFDLDKIRLTLENTSDELGKPLTGADLRLLMGAIEENIMGLEKKILESKEIYGIVIDELRNFGFEQIRKAYEEFRKDFDSG